MFRRRGSDKAKMEPELCVLLRNVARYPGDTLQGVVIVNFAAPVDLITLELCLTGDERATIGSLLITDRNPEARKTLYYEQFITLRGVDHDALEQRRGLLGRRRTVVSHDAMLRNSVSNASSTMIQAGVSSPEVGSTENSVMDMSPSILNGSAAGSVHLVPGTYSFPFKVVLPATVPPSRELRRAREGVSLLRYRAIATMILVGGKAYTAEVPFRVNPLPVQTQRWFELHGDEQHGTDGSESDEVATHDMDSPNLEGAPSRVGLKSRLMSSAGTISTYAADREREVTCQRRFRHYRQFPEQQLMADHAEREKRAEASEEDGGVPASPHGKRESTAPRKESISSSSSRRPKPKTYRERRARQDEADNRSLDANGDKDDAAFGQLSGEEDGDDDEVIVFDAEDSGVATVAAAAPDSPSGAGDRSLAANTTADAASSSKKSKMKKKHRHHSKSEAATSSALVENVVEKLAFTPPEEDLAPVPAHIGVRHSVDATAAAAEGAASTHKKSHRRKSRDARGAKNEEDAEADGDEKDAGEKSLGTQAHKRRVRFTPPPWHQEFSINLRGGLLRSGKVKVKLSLRSPLVSVGYGKVAVKLLIDNSDGGGTITKVKYSLVTRCYIRTKTEVYNYHLDAVETVTDVNIEKGTIVAVPEVEVPVPKTTPLTMLTEGMGTLTFLNVRFYVGTTLKTFSKSVETEVVLVPGQDSQNNSRRLLRWTCFFRRRNNEDTRDLTVRPPNVNLSMQNSKVRVMQATDLARSASPPLGNADADTSSMAPSAMSRSLVLMRNSKRVGKNAPPLDTRRLASALNYDEAIFVPPAEDSGPAGPNSHADPMSMLNPFAAPLANLGSSLPSPDRDDNERM